MQYININKRVKILGSSSTLDVDTLGFDFDRALWLFDNSLLTVIFIQESGFYLIAW